MTLTSFILLLSEKCFKTGLPLVTLLATIIGSPDLVRILGPLMYKTKDDVHVLIGVVSFGPSGCVDNTLPSVYSRVTEVLDWIVTYVQLSKTCLPSESELHAKLQHHY